MPSVLNTDPILSVPNETGVVNVLTVPNVPKVTKNDPSVPKKPLSVPTGVPNVKCTKVHKMYKNSLEMMPSLLNSDSIPHVPKCNWFTKRNDCNKRTENDQE